MLSVKYQFSSPLRPGETIRTIYVDDNTRTRREAANQATDWDRYYTTVPFTARLTRRYSTAVLLDAIKRHALSTTGDERLSVIEIGGANSCFMDAILSRFHCRSYDVIDTNRYGLSLLEKRVGQSQVVRLHQQSVLDLSTAIKADIVFSVGLVEHFDATGTRQAVLAHFDLLRPGALRLSLSQHLPCCTNDQKPY